MNNRTANLIRNIAAKRGNTKPSYIKHLKREWYSLNEQERELKRIEYRTELDNYEAKIRNDAQGLIRKKDETIREYKSRVDAYEKRLEDAKGDYSSVNQCINSAGFIARLRYLFYGSITALK